MDEKFSNVKIVILGTPSVGKTSLRRTYLGKSFRENYIETIGSDFSFKELIIKNTEIGLALWDIAGQERFLDVHPLFYKGSYGCVVVYSTVDRPTFDDVESWVDRFVTHSNRENLPIMVIGNKIDLIPEVDNVITEEEELKLMNRLKNKYPNREFYNYRTSALDGRFVDEAFTKFAEIVYEWIINTEDEKSSSKFNLDDIDVNIPGAYAIVMNQITGPMIVSTSPPIDSNSDEYYNLSNSGVKLIASLDFNDIISQSTVISSFPWIKPRGDFHYIAFVVDNSKARGKKELFVIGVNVQKELAEPIYGIKGVLDGLLYNTLNEVVKIIQDNKIDYITSTFRVDDEGVKNVSDSISHVLLNLRQKLDKSLKRWYNIPS